MAIMMAMRIAFQTVTVRMMAMTTMMATTPLARVVFGILTTISTLLLNMLVIMMVMAMMSVRRLSITVDVCPCPRAPAHRLSMSLQFLHVAPEHLDVHILEDIAKTQVLCSRLLVFWCRSYDNMCSKVVDIRLELKRPYEF